MNPTDFQEELSQREQQYRSQPTIYMGEDVAAWKAAQLRAYAMSQEGYPFEWMAPYRSPNIVTVEKGKVTVQRGEQVQEFDVPSGYRVQQMQQTGEGLEIGLESKEGLASRQFYGKLGYPQFAGKYQPFEIPQGYRVKDVKETNEGLQVAFEPIPEEKGLAERMKEWTIVPLAERFGLRTFPKSPMGMISYVQGKPVETHPLAGIAGLVVAPAESLVYSVGRLMGFQTPRIPATVSGGLVSSGIESVMKGQLTGSAELKEALENPEYFVGTLFGDILLGWAIGKGAEKAISPIVGKVQGSTAKWLTKSYEESARLGELWKPSLAEKVAMKVTRAAPRQFSTAIIGLPRMAEAEALGMTNMSKFMMGMEAFEWTEVPRTIGFGLTEPILVTGRGAAKEGIMAGLKQVAKETLPYVVYQAGRQVSLAQPSGILGFEKVRYTMGFSGKLGFAKAKLPSLKDLLKETKGELVFGSSPLAQVIMAAPEILPKLSIIPELAAEGLPKVAPQIFGAGFVLIPHLLGREVQKPKREAKTKPVARLAVGSIAKTILSQRQQPIQIPKQITRQIQKQQQIQIQRIPVPQITRTTFPIPKFPSLPEGSSLASAILGKKEAWFYKRHPVATGKEVAAHIFEGLPRQKKRKR